MLKKINKLIQDIEYEIKAVLNFKGKVIDKGSLVLLLRAIQKRLEKIKRGEM